MGEGKPKTEEEILRAEGYSYFRIYSTKEKAEGEVKELKELNPDAEFKVIPSSSGNFYETFVNF